MRNMRDYETLSVLGRQGQRINIAIYEIASLSDLAMIGDFIKKYGM